MTKRPIHWKNHFVELLVVIFGITIAFAIDKYAENRKEASEMRVALESIMDDLRRDISRYDNNQIPSNQEKVDELDYIIQQMKQEKLDDDSMHVLIGRTFGSFNSRITNATYESLKSSGKLEDIPNVEVRRRVISHYQSNYPQSDYLSNDNVAFASKLADYVSRISPAFFTGNFGDRELLSDPGFRSMMARWRGMVYFKVQEYKRLSRESKRLLEFMQKELDQHGKG